MGVAAPAMWPHFALLFLDRDLRLLKKGGKWEEIHMEKKTKQEEDTLPWKGTTPSLRNNEAQGSHSISPRRDQPQQAQQQPWDRRGQQTHEPQGTAIRKSQAELQENQPRLPQGLWEVTVLLPGASSKANMSSQGSHSRGSMGCPSTNHRVPPRSHLSQGAQHPRTATGSQLWFHS